MPSKDAGTDLATWLAARFEHADLAGWAARLAAGEVEVDGVQWATTAPVTGRSRVVWHRPPWEEPPAPLHYEVVHEDADVLIVDKPSGLPTMPSGGYLDHTLLTVVQKDHPEAVPMHRLGTGTSGLVVFGRTRVARVALQAAWRGREVQKDYVAWVEREPAPREQVVRVPIGPVPHALLGTVFAASEAGREAVSHVSVRGSRGNGSLVDVRIDTGRPHQIRIHMAAIGHPLVGDPLYVVGGHARGDVRPSELGYWLHARRVGFRHPGTGAWVVVERGAAWEGL